MSKVAKAFKENFDKAMVMRGAAAIIIGIALFVVFNMMTPNLKRIGDEYKNQSFCIVSEDGSYIEIDTNPFDFEDHISHGSLDAIRNINEQLGFPDSVYAQMGSTRAIDGVQVYEKDGFNVQWTYHPDNGLEVIYSVE